jgi:hypothetical protein
LIGFLAETGVVMSIINTSDKIIADYL